MKHVKLDEEIVTTYGNWMLVKCQPRKCVTQQEKKGNGSKNQLEGIKRSMFAVLRSMDEKLKVID